MGDLDINVVDKTSDTASIVHMKKNVAGETEIAIPAGQSHARKFITGETLEIRIKKGIRPDSPEAKSSITFKMSGYNNNVELGVKKSGKKWILTNTSTSTSSKNVNVNVGDDDQPDIIDDEG